MFRIDDPHNLILVHRQTCDLIQMNPLLWIYDSWIANNCNYIIKDIRLLNCFNLRFLLIRKCLIHEPLVKCLDIDKITRSRLSLFLNHPFSRLFQWFCRWCRLQDRAPGAPALYGGFGEVGLSGPGSPGGLGAQPVLRPTHHRLHQTVSVRARSQRVH